MLAAVAVVVDRLLYAERLAAPEVVEMVAGLMAQILAL
jgi:hypothetical protein